jgi:hypothetical protein
MAAAPEGYTSSLIEALRAGTPQSGVSAPSMQLMPNSPNTSTSSLPTNFVMPSMTGNTMPVGGAQSGSGTASGNTMQIPGYTPLPTYVPPVQPVSTIPEYDYYYWNSQVG